MCLFIFIAISCLINSNLVFSCGITTHTEIAHRAASHYDNTLFDLSIADLIKEYQPAFQAGNPYPDSFYPSICKKGVYNYVSEDTHWTPFLNATIKYIQKTYQRPYSKDALQLITFLLGFTSHQIADITWHSLGVNEGFLTTMGDVNFHGSFPQAHSVGDPGGDVVNQFELNLQYIADLKDWYVPYRDLYNIYNEYYGKEVVNEADIIECSSLLFIGRLAEQLAMSLLYADYFKKSAFMVDKLNDYYLGGLDDMAAWTQKSWDKVIYMIEQGVEKCKLDHNILYVDCPNLPNQMHSNITHLRQTKDYKSREPRFIYNNILDKSFIKSEVGPMGLTLKPSEKFNKIFNTQTDYKRKLKDLFEKKNLIEMKKNAKVLNSSATYFISNEQANLGWSVASGDLNNDGFDDLVIGAPIFSKLPNHYQDGAVFIVLSKNDSLPSKNMNLETDPDYIINPPKEAIRSRFGNSITVLDINQDGFNDIVISSPSYDLDNINYEGRVFIYYGNGQGRRYSEPSVRITCKDHKYCNLGWNLGKGDVNGDQIDDLIISTPYASTCQEQCGLVSVLFSNKTVLSSQIDVSNLNWTLHGNMPYEWFGYSVKAKLGLIAVGAPQSRICYKADCSYSEQDVQAVGRLYIYKYPSTNPINVLVGQTQYEQLGYDFDMSRQIKADVIAVSSVAKDSKLKNNTFVMNRAGEVGLYSIGHNYSLSLISTLKSDRAYSAFGSKVKFYNKNQNDFEDLYISSQMRSNNPLLVVGVQEGAVYMFKGGESFPYHNVTDECPAVDITPCPERHATLIFKNHEEKSRFGFDFAFVSSKLKNHLQLAVSSIHGNFDKTRLSGKVNLFNLY